MRFNDEASIVVEKKVPDGYGGYMSIDEHVCDIKVTVAPYSVAVGEVCKVPNPKATLKFFTNSTEVDEDSYFFVIYKGKRYKKISITYYGKCALIMGEKI
jgi:hypothetical protein